MTDKQAARLDEIDRLIKAGSNDPRLYNERMKLLGLGKVCKGSWQHGRKRPGR